MSSTRSGVIRVRSGSVSSGEAFLKMALTGGQRRCVPSSYFNLPLCHCSGLDLTFPLRDLSRLGTTRRISTRRVEVFLRILNGRRSGTPEPRKCGTVARANPAQSLFFPSSHKSGAFGTGSWTDTLPQVGCCRATLGCSAKKDLTHTINVVALHTYVVEDQNG